MHWLAYAGVACVLIMLFVVKTIKDDEDDNVL
jgi:hypothetical protein